MIDTQDVFIRQYQVASKSGMTLSQFASFLNIKPESVTRKRHKLKQVYGIVLDPLPLVNGGQYIEMPDTWQDVFDDRMQKHDHTSLGARKLVITSAQNATKVFRPFLNTLKKYCEHNNAQLIVIPYRYKNPTSVWSNSNKDQDWWDPSISPYIVNDYIQLTKSLQLFGPVKTQPTATNPLSGYDSVSGMDSAIFGHPKVQLLTCATPGTSLPKILSTTGAITVPNYTPTKTGFKGHFHHNLAAMVIEIDEDGLFFPRHIHASEDDGSFYDLDSYYTQKTVNTGVPIAGLVTGDSHFQFICPEVHRATYGPGPDSMLSVLQPPKVVMHDIEDFYPRNHHHNKMVLTNFGKHHFNRSSVQNGLQITADFLDVIPKGVQRIIVKSNHDEALNRWLNEADPKTDPENAKLYHYLMYNCLKHLQPTDTGFTTIDPFEFWCKNPESGRGLRNIEDTVFLKRDQSYTISSIECGFHGDKGPNGARGSIKAFAKIGPKTVIGHSHSPGIHEGCYQVGVSARLNLEYVSGPSSWMNTHCIIYKSGKRTLINIINGKWRYTPPNISI